MEYVRKNSPGAYAFVNRTWEHQRRTLRRDGVSFIVHHAAVVDRPVSNVSGRACQAVCDCALWMILIRWRPLHKPQITTEPQVHTVGSFTFPSWQARFCSSTTSTSQPPCIVGCERFCHGGVRGQLLSGQKCWVFLYFFTPRETHTVTVWTRRLKFLSLAALSFGLWLSYTMVGNRASKRHHPQHQLRSPSAMKKLPRYDFAGCWDAALMWSANERN